MPLVQIEQDGILWPSDAAAAAEAASAAFFIVVSWYSAAAVGVVSTADVAAAAADTVASAVGDGGILEGYSQRRLTQMCVASSEWQLDNKALGTHCIIRMAA